MRAPTLNRRAFVLGLSTSALLASRGATPVAAGTQAAEPQAGGELKWGHADTGYIGKQFPWTMAGGLNHAAQIKMAQEGPFFRNADLAIEPNLAAAVEYDADYTAFTLTINQGITWSDGQPYTARDVYGTVLMGLHPDTTWSLSATYALLKGGRDYLEGKTEEPPPGLVLVDDYTLRFEMDAPWSYAANDMLAGQQTLPWHIYQPIFENPETRAQLRNQESPIFLEPEMQIGTGPFIFERGEADRYLRYAKNPTYHGQAPYLDAIEFVKLGSPDATLVALERGEVDVISITDFSYLPSLQEMEGVQAYEVPDYYLRALLYNWNKPYLNDPRIYQAIDMAIDRDTLCTNVLGGACSGWREYGYGTEGFVHNPYDPEQAKALLEEAGWDSSIDLEVMTDYTDTQTAELLPAIVAMLGQVGIKAHPRTYQGPALTEHYDKGEVDLWYNGTWATTTFLPGNWDPPVYVDAAGQSYDEWAEGREFKSGNRFGFHPEWLQALVAEERAASPERRAAIRAEVEERLATEGSSFMILARYKRFLAFRDTVHGLDNPDSALWAFNVYVNNSQASTWWKS
jgi:ABC-type transport system substrate-binding protein